MKKQPGQLQAGLSSLVGSNACGIRNPEPARESALNGIRRHPGALRPEKKG